MFLRSLLRKFQLLIQFSSWRDLVGCNVAHTFHIPGVAIQIRARHPVFRRYVLAEELLALGIAEGGVGPATINSGGERVEMAELAARIATVLNPDAVITRDGVDPRDTNRYHSDGQDWERRCRSWDLASEPLDRQIEITARGVLSRA